MPKTRIINFTNMHYKHIRENKTLANIAEFTVYYYICITSRNQQGMHYPSLKI